MGEATNEACMDRLKLYLRVEDGCITACTFQAEGCPPTIALGSFLTQYLRNRTVDSVRSLTERELEELVDGLPRTKRHAAMLAIDALRQAIQEYDKKTKRGAEDGT